MKKDGFVSMTLVYTFLVLFLFLMLAVLHAYTQQNKYLEAIDSKIDLTINTPISDNYCPYSIGQVFTYDFTGNRQTFISACNGIFKIELWGAQGGGSKGGKGAYVSGNIKLEKSDTLYVYVGENPTNTFDTCGSSNQNSSYNGVASGSCVGGGGATDVRLIDGSWNNARSLESRIIIAAGGGGANDTSNSTYKGGAGGSIYGYTAVSSSNPGTGGRQTSSSFGQGTNGNAAGGGGYYGGLSGNNGGGGSSYISGHTGCIAIAAENTTIPRNDSNDIKCVEGTEDIVCSYHFLNKIFTNTIMKDGNESMPNPTGAGEITGNTGHGHAKITYLSE